MRCTSFLWALSISSLCAEVNETAVKQLTIPNSLRFKFMGLFPLIEYCKSALTEGNKTLLKKNYDDLLRHFFIISVDIEQILNQNSEPSFLSILSQFALSIYFYGRALQKDFDTLCNRLAERAPAVCSMLKIFFEEARCKTEGGTRDNTELAKEVLKISSFDKNFHKIEREVQRTGTNSIKIAAVSNTDGIRKQDEKQDEKQCVNAVRAIVSNIPIVQDKPSKNNCADNKNKQREESCCGNKLTGTNKSKDGESNYRGSISKYSDGKSPPEIPICADKQCPQKMMATEGLHSNIMNVKCVDPPINIGEHDSLEDALFAIIYFSLFWQHNQKAQDSIRRTKYLIKQRLMQQPIVK